MSFWRMSTRMAAAAPRRQPVSRLDDPASTSNTLRGWLLGASVLGITLPALIVSLLSAPQYEWSTLQKWLVAVASISAFAFGALPAFMLARERLSVRTTVQRVLVAIVASCVVHLGSAVGLIVATIQSRGVWVSACQYVFTQPHSFCESSFVRIMIGLVGSLSLLPILGTHICWRLFQHSRTLATVRKDDELVPPGWYEPPAELAPESSDSGGETDSYALESKTLSARGPSSSEGPIDKSKWSKVRRSKKAKDSSAGNYAQLPV